jgi:two-component system, OmpR family, phosphate regulon sensor histidine kinase PhoR
LSPVQRSTAAAFLAAACAGLVVALLAGPAWGWAALAAVLAVFLVHHARNLAHLERWLARPAPAGVPEGTGAWDKVLSALHRYERAAAGRQSELAEALARFRRAAQAMPDGVVLLDAHNCIEWCNDNAAAMLELDPRADIGRPIANLVRDPSFVEYLATHESDDRRSVPVPAARGVTLAIRLVPYGDEQKLMLARDVTQAERLETMRRDFVANVSHELRTPLTVLVGFLETVRELKLDPQRVRDYLSMMDEQAARMQRIIDDLLALSVLESAPAPPLERVPMAPLLARLRGDAEALSRGRHAISLEGAPAFDLLGSEGELASAFGNLLSNAVRYTPEGGRVRLLWRDGPDGATFSVEDSGPGIAPEHIPRLTERFYRVDRSRSRETGGTGLGLAIVKHALARHQATLEIESELGKGSRFSARFPPQRTSPVGVRAPSPN